MGFPLATSLLCKYRRLFILRIVDGLYAGTAGHTPIDVLALPAGPVRLERQQAGTGGQQAAE